MSAIPGRVRRSSAGGWDEASGGAQRALDDRTRTDGWHRVGVPDSQREATKIINTTKEMEHGAPTSLDLAGLSLRELPLETFTVQSLVSLNAGNNEMSAVPRAMENLTNLRQLRMPQNRFQAMPAPIFSMVNLTKIALSGNQITSIPTDISTLGQLKVLQLANNCLSKLPDEIACLTSLEQLDVSGNSLTTLPQSLAGLGNLARLTMRCNQFSEVPESVSQLSALRMLNLRCNNLSSVSPVIGACASLRVLILRYNCIESLPEELGSLSDLRELDIYDNRLRDLPSSLGSLTNLTELMIKENPLHPQLLRATRRGAQGILAYVRMQAKSGPSPLERMPSRWGLGTAASSVESSGEGKQVDLSATLVPINQEVLQKLSSNAQEVDGINLSHNNLTSVNPQIVSSFTMLKNLNLCQNSLLNVPSSLGNLKHLTVLDLSGNMLEVLPRTFSQIRSLEVLNLSVNRLCTLPPTFGELSNLKQVFLYCNNIGFLPANIRLLTKLEVLDLHKNRLTSIPADIGSLLKMTSLNLAYNRLTDLPMELCSLSMLSSLDARCNLLRQLPKRLEGLVSLAQLDLSTNRLVDVAELTKLPALAHCVLDNQGISSLPDLSSMTTLTSLSVASNNLEEIPESLRGLHNLASLDISRNRFVFPPIGLEVLPVLAELKLDHNPWAWNVSASMQTACNIGINAVLQLLEHYSDTIEDVRAQALSERPVSPSSTEQYEKWLAYKAMEKWSVEDVGMWLGHIGLEYLQRKAGQMSIDGRTLIALEEAELEEALLLRSKLDLAYLRKRVLLEKDKVMSFKKVSVRPTMRSSGGLLRRNRDERGAAGEGRGSFGGMGGARMRRAVVQESSQGRSASPRSNFCRTENVRVTSTTDGRSLTAGEAEVARKLVPQGDRAASAPAAPSVLLDRRQDVPRSSALATERAGTRLGMGLSSRQPTSRAVVQQATRTEASPAHTVRVIRMWKVAAPNGEEEESSVSSSSESPSSPEASPPNSGWFSVNKPESR